MESPEEHDAILEKRWGKRDRRGQRLGCLVTLVVLAGLAGGLLYIAYKPGGGGPAIDADAVAVADAFTRATFIRHDCKTANRYAVAVPIGHGALPLCNADSVGGVHDIRVQSHRIVRKCSVAATVLGGAGFGLINVVPSHDCVSYRYAHGVMYYVMTKDSGTWKVAFFAGIESNL
jgi:hypothetical protein